MNELAKLSRLDRFARQVADGVKGLTPPPDQPDPLAAVRPQLQHLGTAARNLSEMARSPAKIGIVGEFSAGKTLLLGALTGAADRLPIDESPTTGNVTALHFASGPDGEPTRIERLELEYLDDDRVALCLAFMLLEARARAQDAHLPDDLTDEIRGLLGPGLDALTPDKVDRLTPDQRAALVDPDRLSEKLFQKGSRS